MPRLFTTPPMVDFRPSITHCPGCGGELKVLKTRTRTVSTLHVGRFRAREVFLICKSCAHPYRSEKLCALVAPGANFGYDVMVYAGKALLLRHRNQEEVVAELARRNVQISPREVSLLSMKFVVYTTIAHQRRAPEITANMQTRGGYICHLDATCEGRDPLLMSSIDWLSEIVLGNVKLPAEDEKHIVPFLERIKKTFGIPLALVHDMGKGILKAVARVFPDVPDFICHFHFLRDIGKDFLGTEYDIIRDRLSKHAISAKLRYRAKQLKRDLDRKPELIQALETGIGNTPLPIGALQFLPVLNVYTLIQWTLRGKSEGHGYGFPFDHPHLAFAKRIRRLHVEVENLKAMQLRGEWKDNKPYFKIHVELKNIMKDRTLWKSVQTPSGPIRIQPQRTNNILEQFFRSLKRANRRRTGNASSSRMLRTMLAETPLVRNLNNPNYMKILLNRKASLEELFADIEIDTLREAFRKAQDTPEKIPSKLKPLIAMPDFPEKLLAMVKKAVA